MKRHLSFVLIALMLVLSACQTTVPPTIDETVTTAPADTTKAPDTTDPADTTTAPDTTVSQTPDTTAPDTDVVVTPTAPEYINPLTGLPTTKELASKRPVAIMLNNIKIANPQDGISSADIIYECLAEGGITRLMMVTLDHASLGVVGSVRSAREYFVDLSQNHDAIFVHAGGSPGAYETIFAKNLDYLDFVNGKFVSSYFYRDQWRVEHMGNVHSVVTTGPMLANAFAAKNFRTEISPSYVNPFNFVEYGTEKIPAGEAVNSITIPHSVLQISSFVYDAENKVYDHYQFNGEPHIDRLNGKKVSTENVIVLFCKETVVDSALRIDVETIGSGDGLYLYGGRYIPIKWTRANENDVMHFTKTDGTPLEINRGKTFISIVNEAIRSSITVK